MFVSVFESRPNTTQSFYIFIVSYVFFTKFSIYCISALRYTTNDGESKDSAARLTNHLVNIR